jgi:hypothetical protein
MQQYVPTTPPAGEPFLPSPPTWWPSEGTSTPSYVTPLGQGRAGEESGGPERAAEVTNFSGTPMSHRNQATPPAAGGFTDNGSGSRDRGGGFLQPKWDSTPRGGDTFGKGGSQQTRPRVAGGLKTNEIMPMPVV